MYSKKLQKPETSDMLIGHSKAKHTLPLVWSCKDSYVTGEIHASKEYSYQPE